jgi:hypothetical protein
VLSRLKDVHSVNVAAPLVDHTLEVLQRFGAARCEGLVLWVGQVHGGQALVEDVWTPRQNPIRSEQGVGYFVEADVLFELNHQLASSKMRLLAQVHSHPSEAFHSETDDAYAIVTTEGGLSLVVPDFGRAPADPSSWAVYRLVDAQWTELSPPEARRLFSTQGGRVTSP